MRAIFDFLFRRESEYEKRLHLRTEEIGRRHGLSPSERIAAFHEARREIQSEIEENQPILENLFVAEIGELVPQFEPLSHRIACYNCQIHFRNQNPELVVYPGKNGQLPSAKKKRWLIQQLNEFENSVDSALVELPRKLRKLCAQYGIETVIHAADSEMIANIEWQNVKLESPKWIECYTANHVITRNFDIVMRFRRSIFGGQFILKHVYFDG